MIYPKSLRQANAQLTIIPMPDSVLSIGCLEGAGLTYTPEGYNGNTIIRATDIHTDPTNTAWSSWEVADNGGANESIWNANHTLLRVIAAGTGTTRVLGFDGRKCTIANPYSKAPVGAAWDTTDPNVDYSLNGTVITKRTFDWMNPLAPPTIEQIYDFRATPGLEAMGKVLWNAGPSIFGTTLVVGFSDRGPQQTGQYVVTYDMATQQSFVWNTLTGQIFGLGKVTTFYPFTLHTVIGYRGGIVIASVGNIYGGPKPHGPFLWRVGSREVKLITTVCGGHETMGYKRYVNVASGSKWASRIFANLKDVHFISSDLNVNFPNPQDQHLGWQNADSTDMAPIFCTQVSIKQPQPLKISSPLQNELWAVEPGPTPKPFIRICPVMTSGIGNPFNFRSQFAILGVDPTGTCVAFSSDWMGSLGNCDGVTSACTLGAGKPNAARSDVFIVVPQ